MLMPLGIRQPTLHRTAVRTANKKAVRAVFVQCDACGANGTGTTNGDRIVSVNLPTMPHGTGPIRHTCGGRFAGFDIEVGS